MTLRSKVGLVAAVLFTLVNLGGAVYAALQGEAAHAGLHGALLFVGAYFVWRLAPTRDAGRLWRGSAIGASTGEPADRLSNLEQSVDAVAIEVERIGEGQRFMTRLFTNEGVPRPAGVADPIENAPRKAPPDDRL